MVLIGIKREIIVVYFTSHANPEAFKLKPMIIEARLLKQKDLLLWP